MKEERINWKVCVRCFTYNHSGYIIDTLNGFCIQETDFPYVCTIVDDASIDGEQEVIRKYLEENFALDDRDVSYEKETDYAYVIYAQHKTNKNCYFVVLFLKQNHYSNPSIKRKKFEYISEWYDNTRYIALCEGDDYWIDPLKLQKQVDIFETNKDVSMVYTAFNTVDKNGNLINPERFEEFIERSHTGWVFFDLLVYCNFIMTLTTMFRQECILKLDVNTLFDWDYFLHATRMGKAYFIDDRTSCYRINPSSIMHTCSHILKRPFYIAVLRELDLVLSNRDGKTAKGILRHPWKKTIIGYIVARYLKKSPYRNEFMKLLLKNPKIWIYVLKGIFIRLCFDSDFRKKVNKF